MTKLVHTIVCNCIQGDCIKLVNSGEMHKPVSTIKDG